MKLFDELNFDEDAHAHGHCRFGLIAECSAEEQRIKLLIIKNLKSRIGFLRQWLNEDRIDNPEKMVSSEQIEDWLFK